jgi:hypothetical protein
MSFKLDEEAASAVVLLDKDDLAKIDKITLQHLLARAILSWGQADRRRQGQVHRPAPPRHPCLPATTELLLNYCWRQSPAVDFQLIVFTLIAMNERIHGAL